MLARLSEEMRKTLEAEKPEEVAARDLADAYTKQCKQLGIETDEEVRNKMRNAAIETITVTMAKPAAEQIKKEFNDTYVCYLFTTRELIARASIKTLII